MGGENFPVRQDGEDLDAAVDIAEIDVASIG